MSWITFPAGRTASCASSGMRRLPFILAIILLIMSARQASATLRYVNAGDTSGLNSAISASVPGDSIILRDGSWTDAEIVLDVSGSSGQAITLKAENPGRVFLKGMSRLRFGGDYLVVDGLSFAEGALDASTSDLSQVVQFRDGSTHANFCRLTNTVIDHYNQEDIDLKYWWVGMYGTNNRVDHCYFAGKNNLGPTLFVDFDGSTSTYHQIDHNFFNGRPQGNGNGFETIRVGTGPVSNTNAYVTVEYNYFYRCNGEGEIISNKSNYNTYRYNTFEECEGALTLRTGHNCTVEGNIFRGNNKPLTGGVRVTGRYHKIFNNYFENLEGSGARAPLTLQCGVYPYPFPPVAEYFQVRDLLVAHNTFVNCKYNMIFGYGYDATVSPYAPRWVNIGNNVIQTTSTLAMVDYQRAPSETTYSANLFYGSNLGISPTPTGIDTTSDPKLVIGWNGLYRPQNSTSAVRNIADTASPYDFITHDFDNQSRSSVRDVGCDEWISSPTPLAPLAPNETGPAWIHQTFSVSTVSSFNSALADALPGNRITLQNGTWANANLVFTGHGLPSLPITLAAETPGSVELAGSSTLAIGGRHMVVDGMSFVSGYLGSGDVIAFRTSVSDTAQHCRLTNTAIVDYNPPLSTTTYNWVRLYGSNNRIDHCRFSGQNHKGYTIRVDVDTTPGNHLIENNYIGNRVNYGGSGYEAVLIGLASTGDRVSNTTFQGNYFENLNSSSRVIYNLSGGNSYAHNTFKGCQGALNLRTGDDCLVEGNLFLGGGISGTGGVAVNGQSHMITNNYFAGLRGSGFHAAISLRNGKYGEVDSNQVRYAAVVSNTIVDCSAGLVFGDGYHATNYPDAPRYTTIGNNAIQAGAGQTMLEYLRTPTYTTYEACIMYGGTMAVSPTPSGIDTASDPKLLLMADGIYRPLNSTSSLIEAAATGTSSDGLFDYSSVTIDLDGQPRSTVPDTGADEWISGYTTLAPRSATEVGPDWN